MSATEIAARIRRHDLSPVEVVDAFFERIEARNSQLNAYVTLLEDEARTAARAAARAQMLSKEELPPLLGVPVAIKDLELTSGVRTTFGARPLEGYLPNRSAPCVERLERAGAVTLGKTNTPEFGHKGTTDNLLFGPTSTPFAPSYNAGGSSGGSAAAVAGGLAALGQGGDGGGSIRIPAAMCGVFGLKPSWGRVPLGGHPNAFVAPPFASLGPLARTVGDAALMMAVIAGPDVRDPSCLPPASASFLAALERGIAGLRIAYSRNLDVFPIDASVDQIVASAVSAFVAAGATVEEVKIGLARPQAELAETWIRDAAVAKAEEMEHFRSAGIDLVRDHSDELPEEFLALVMLGRRQSALEYRLHGVVRTEVFAAVEQLFEHFDLLITPTLAVPGVVNSAGGRTVGPTAVNGEAVNSLVGWCLTYPFNFTGHPAASIPAGLDSGGLPIGLQLVGPRWRDDLVLAASAAFERERPWQHTYTELS